MMKYSVTSSLSQNTLGSVHLVAVPLLILAWHRDIRTGIGKVFGSSVICASESQQVADIVILEPLIGQKLASDWQLLWERKESFFFAIFLRNNFSGPYNHSYICTAKCSQVPFIGQIEFWEPSISQCMRNSNNGSEIFILSQSFLCRK